MPNYPLTIDDSEIENVDNNEDTEVNKTKEISIKVLTQLDKEDQNHSVDSNDGMQKQITSEIDPGKDENYTVDKSMLNLNNSSIESHDYEVKKESEVLTFKLPAILDDA